MHEMVKVAAVVVAISCVTGSADAASIKELQGAWTMNGTDCGDIFKRTGEAIEFKDREASTSTGLLFSDNKVTGPLAICNVKSIRRKNSHLSAQLSCETTMVMENITEIFDIVSPTEFRRFDPFGDNMYVTYKKCDL